MRFGDLKPGEQFKRHGDRGKYLKIRPCFATYGCDNLMIVTAVGLSNGARWHVDDEEEVEQV